MSPFKNIQNVYFLGIGGIGMSALAQYFVLNGFKVSGYDKTPGKMTEKLTDLGIYISFKDSLENVLLEFRNSENTLVVYTPAVPEELEIFRFFKTQKFVMEKRAVTLGKITREMPTLAVAGTHGKTTTSAMLAHLLKQSGYKITAFLGGICENYNSNFICDGKDFCVVEADEFDRSFLHLKPQYAAINSMDPDHLDIYGNAEEMITSFHEFAAKLPSYKNLFFKEGLDLKGNSVSIRGTGDYNVENIYIDKGNYHFDFTVKSHTYLGFESQLPGVHNLMNAATALAMAFEVGANVEDLKNALRSFKGVDRRFTYHLKSDKKILIEDYAHHPTEIAAICHAAREMFPDRTILVVFQPHLYSRTRDFAEGFAESLSGFDQVILLPVYPAREKPIPGIDSSYLLGLIEADRKSLVSKESLPQAVMKSDASVVLMLGAGDIGNEVEPVKKMLQHEK